MVLLIIQDLFQYFYRILLSWSYKGGSTNVVPDKLGNGIRNNGNDGKSNYFVNVGNQYSGVGYNDGFLNRQLKTSYNPRSGDNSSADALNGSNLLRDESNLQIEMKDYTKRVVNDEKSYQVFYTMAVIKLAHLSSFFENLPLTKCFLAKLIINVNVGSLKLTVTPGSGSGGSATLQNMFLKSSDINFVNGTCPIMVSPLGQGLNVESSTTECVLSVNIANVLPTLGTLSHSNLGINGHSMRSCRIYAPIIKMTALKRDEYLLNNRSKIIEWDNTTLKNELSQYTNQISDIQSLNLTSKLYVDTIISSFTELLTRIIKLNTELQFKISEFNLDNLNNIQ